MLNPVAEPMIVAPVGTDHSTEVAFAGIAAMLYVTICPISGHGSVGPVIVPGTAGSFLASFNAFTALTAQLLIVTTFTESPVATDVLNSTVMLNVPCPETIVPPVPLTDQNTEVAFAGIAGML